jgi:hypothetical protein
MSLALAFAPAAAPAAVAAPPPPPPAAPPPGAAGPTLAQLETSMLALAPTSVQIGLSETISGEVAPAGPFGSFGGLDMTSHRTQAGTAKTETILTLSGAISAAPPLATLTGNILGIPVAERQIGTTRWTENSFIGALDGNRPWVEEPGQRLSSGKGATGAVQGSFKQTLGDLRLARGLHEVGPQLVDGVATREFAGSIARRHLRAALHSTGGTELEALAKLVHGSLELSVFIAEDGLPVRTTIGYRLAQGSHHALLNTQLDVPAINVVVQVSPPPASETITKAQLEHLLEPPHPTHKRRHKKHH